MATQQIATPVKRHSVSVYVGLAVVFGAALATMFVVDVSTVIETAAEMTGLTALVAALFQVMRDQSQFEKDLALQREAQLHSLLLQRNDQQFQIGATSHMANVVFDKHVDFCEKYLEEVFRAVDTLFREFMTEQALTHANKLAEIRLGYVAWLTQEMMEELIAFEGVLRKIGAKSGFMKSTEGNASYAEQRTKMYKEIWDHLADVLPMLLEKEQQQFSYEQIIVVVRRILGTDSLVRLRTELIQRANTALGEAMPGMGTPRGDSSAFKST